MHFQGCRSRFMCIFSFMCRDVLCMNSEIHHCSMTEMSRHRFTIYLKLKERHSKIQLDVIDIASSCVHCYTEWSVAWCAHNGDNSSMLMQMRGKVCLCLFEHLHLDYALKRQPCRDIEENVCGWVCVGLIFLQCSVRAGGLKDSFYFTVVQVMRNTSHASRISSSSTPLVSVFLCKSNPLLVLVKCSFCCKITY